MYIKQVKQVAILACELLERATVRLFVKMESPVNVKHLRYRVTLVPKVRVREIEVIPCSFSIAPPYEVLKLVFINHHRPIKQQIVVR